jgi:hypothetical protein
MSHALEELVGQFDLFQRSLLLIYVGLEQGPISFIYGPYPPRASSDQTDVFIAKDAVLLICSFTGLGSSRCLEAKRSRRAVLNFQNNHLQVRSCATVCRVLQR